MLLLSDNKLLGGIMLKSGIDILNKRGLIYLLDKKGEKITYAPWLGDRFSILYDFLMKKNVFPKKFNADIGLHYQILKEVLSEVKNRNILELAAGSGSAVNFLDNSNHYIATDISEGLLRIAKNKFQKAGFNTPLFYVMNAEKLVFKHNCFDHIICIISFNFFSELPEIIKECSRILKKDGYFTGCIPVPEKRKNSSIIRGTLYSENELVKMFNNAGMSFYSHPYHNGALLYFTAKKEM